jgi:hypothetical protein
VRFYGRCGVCQDEQEIRGLATVEQVTLVGYAFWSRHEHTPEQQAAAARAAANNPADPANIPDWEREMLGLDDEGDAS